MPEDLLSVRDTGRSSVKGKQLNLHSSPSQKGNRVIKRLKIFWISRVIVAVKAACSSFSAEKNVADWQLEHLQSLDCPKIILVESSLQKMSSSISISLLLKRDIQLVRAILNPRKHLYNVFLWLWQSFVKMKPSGLSSLGLGVAIWEL